MIEFIEHEAPVYCQRCKVEIRKVRFFHPAQAVPIEQCHGCTRYEEGYLAGRFNAQQAMDRLKDIKNVGWKEKLINWIKKKKDVD